MLEFVRNMKIFGSEDLLWLLSYWSRDILPGNVRLIFGMSMVVIQNLITNFTLLCHAYVEGFDHQMWHMTGFQLLWIVTGASCMWGQETHTPEFFPERLISLTLGSSWLHLFIIYTSQNVSILRLRLWINDSGLFAWISLTALSQDLFYSWTGQKIRHVHAIAVVLALEDYQNSIAKNLRVRDIPVDIYGLAMVSPPGERSFFPPDRGRDFFSPGRGGNLFVHQTGGEIFSFF